MSLTLSTLLMHGFNSPDAALFLTRVATGGFFAISGFNKLFNSGRHASLTANLVKNKIPYISFMCWFVPFWELWAGALLAVGMFTTFHAAVLMIICIVAAMCESRQRVEAYHPINTGDRIADYLYLQEILYMLLLAVSILAGSGKYSLDNLLFN